MALYKIVRVYASSRPKRTLRTGLTLAEAQAHCSDPETSWKTATSEKALNRTRRMGPWFDAYYPMEPQ
jgi:hypothetical protein